MRNGEKFQHETAVHIVVCLCMCAVYKIMIREMTVKLVAWLSYRLIILLACEISPGKLPNNSLGSW